MADLVTRADPQPSAAAPIPAWWRHPGTLAASGFLLVRSMGLLVLSVAPERDRPLIEVLGIWDGGWYVRIAESGYADQLDLSAPATDQSTGSLAFFPLYPMLMRLVSSATGLDPRWAGVLISWTAGAIAAAGIAVLATAWADRRVGVLAGVLWATAPVAVVGSLVYTETLFTALAVSAFVALRREMWLVAGLLGALAGLTRPTGIAVGTAVAAYGALTWWRAYRERNPAQPKASILPLLGGALALTGTPAFWIWAGIRAERWDAWFAVQNAFWGSHFDGGASILRLAKTVVLGDSPAATALMDVAVLVCLLLSVLLLALAIRTRVWWPLLVYAVISLVMVVGSDGYSSSKLRFLVPIFVLAFPLARWLGKRAWPIQSLVVAAAIAATTVSGTWLLLGWPYAI